MNDVYFADEVDVPGPSTFCRSSSELLVSVYLLKSSLEVLSEESSEDSSHASAMLFFSVKELSWLRIKSLLLMTHLLVIGFSKAIRGKGLSKNKPTCENAVA